MRVPTARKVARGSFPKASDAIEKSRPPHAEAPISLKGRYPGSQEADDQVSGAPPSHAMNHTVAVGHVFLLLTVAGAAQA